MFVYGLVWLHALDVEGQAFKPKVDSIPLLRSTESDGQGFVFFIPVEQQVDLKKDFRVLFREVKI